MLCFKFGHESLVRTRMTIVSLAEHLQSQIIAMQRDDLNNLPQLFMSERSLI